MCRFARCVCVLSLLLAACCAAVRCAGVPFNLSKPAAPSAAAVQASSDQSGGEQSFVSFARSHGKVYTAAEFPRRFAIFAANAALIDAHNAAQTASHRLGLTEHADWTAAEFKQYRLGYRRPAEDGAATWADSACDASVYSAAVPGAELDWRASSAVSGVKNQGQCGACWSFAATGSVEGVWAIQNGQLLSLSEQQLLDCSGAEGDEGCSGGYTASALQFVIDNEGICSEADYTYVGYQDSQCHDECSAVASIASHTCVAPLNESALLQAVSVQPVAVAIEADQSVFQHYTGGVIDDDKCGTQLDHAVLVIGYGTDSSSGKPYWIVKNSWGSGWGIGGYALIARNKNMCGIASEPVLPVLAAPSKTNVQ